ncbi:hypothetical protein L1987_61232 [Smallanthus sonchifolius]|uniref:Uncharacterized protein n=1 Tax=Smallanthus sonchifolius TaxID=185202 RepID=A0ACB9DAG7_9ASTR|nr:hypothetical protein L1987_61232 [Smallanthus sonchifolius]
MLGEAYGDGGEAGLSVRMAGEGSPYRDKWWFVVEYDIDFGLFDKAVNGGVVPPFSISGNDSEMCLPARQSGWERLRRKFESGVMKDLVASSKEVESPDSCSSSDEDECMSPDSSA